MPAKQLKTKAIAAIKEITGGDNVSARALYGNPHKLITTGGFRLLFGSNHPISLAESDDAFWNRLVYLPFVNPVPKDQQDPHLLEKLLAEKDAIVTTALQYLPELVQNNFQLAGEEETQAAIANYERCANRSISDIIAEFLADAIVPDSEGFVKTEDLRAAFCSTTGIMIDNSTFGKHLRRYLLQMPGVTEGRVPASIDPGKPRGYKGISLCTYIS